MEGTVHHLAVVGCASRLETPRNLWNCGANGNPALEPGYPALTPCHSEVGERHTHTCKWKQILTGLLFHFSVTGQHDQHIVFMEPWRQGGHLASRHRLPCRRGLQSSLPCASGELWTFFPSSLLFLANSFSHKYPIIKKVHYINVDYLSSNGDTAGVDLLFTDKVALKCQIRILFAFVKLSVDCLSNWVSYRQKFSKCL